MECESKVTPNSKFASNRLYNWVKRGTMKCLAQEHNLVPRLGLEPRPPDSNHNATALPN